VWASKIKFKRGIFQHLMGERNEVSNIKIGKRKGGRD